MSELINKTDNRATIRWKLLTGASAMALTAYVMSASIAKAEDADRPQIWIELGGQMEMMQGFFKSFTAPFMYITPTPAPYRGNVFNQNPAHITFDWDGKIRFQPEESDWIFSAGIQFGRSHGKRHSHHQTTTPALHGSPHNIFGSGYPRTFSIYTSAFADMQAPFSESHSILDFQAGKDIGIGLLGSNGSSQVDVGVRFAQFRSHRAVDAMARPEVDTGLYYWTFYHIVFVPTVTRNFHNYALDGEAWRSFNGIGPSLSWNGTAAIAGNPQDGELTLDFGVSGAVLFGRQKAKTSHETQTHYHHETFSNHVVPHVHRFYTGTSTGNYSTRSRRATVPELSGFVGLSARYSDLKLSIGYKGDIWFSAIDRGIDARKNSNLTFNGPYAAISIGLGD